MKRKIRVFYALFFIFLTYGPCWLSAQETSQAIYISVLPIESKDITASLLPVLADEFRKSLNETGIFKVMEREMMDKLLTEQAFQLTGVVDDATIVKVGQIIGVTRMVSASITKVAAQTYTVAAKMVDIQTGNILATASEIRDGDSFDINKRMLYNIAFVLAGKPTQDHLDYLKTQEQQLAEQQKVEKRGTTRFRVMLNGMGYYPLHLLQTNDIDPKKAFYEKETALKEWSLPKDQMEFGEGGTFAYKINSSWWLVGKAGYTPTSTGESHALGEYYNDTTFSVGSDIIRLEGPSTHLTQNSRYYNLFDLGLGAQWNFFQNPRIAFGFSAIPEIGFITYYADEFDSSYTNNNFYVNGMFMGKGQIYSESVRHTTLSGNAFGLDLAFTVDFFLLENLSICSNIGLNTMFARTLEGTANIHDYEITRDPFTADTTNREYTENAALENGNYFGTGEFFQIQNPDVKQYDSNGRLISTEKAMKEFANFRITVGLVYSF